LRAVLVDDEPLARERLALLLDEAETPVEVVAEAGAGTTAAEQIRETAPDVVFLDIQMPMLDGFDVLDLLPEPRPHIVFVTAHEEHALDAFDVHAADYLTKPVRLSRLEDTLQHLARLHGGEQTGGAHGDTSAPPHDDPSNGASDDASDEPDDAAPLKRLTASVGNRLRVLDPDDVRYFEADDKLVFAHLADGTKHVVDFTLKALTERLNAASAGPVFLRTHRAYLVNLGYVHELVPWFSGTYRLRLQDGTDVPVARRRVARVKRLLGT
jgi:DNA-binding LytR/AlgR family response regulator